ncbi:MAG: hypothetical protein JO077_06890 [Verrucomicrobia bacterium]|nr:hypothetical protein [Verrucomicrobiota bacterium]
MLPYLFFVLFINARVATLDHSAGQHSLASAKATASRTPIAQPSFFSVYNPVTETSETQVTVHCKTLRDVNNLEQRITIVGNVQEDLVSSVGKIIVPAGTKVIGEGFCDPDRNRILSRDHWTFYVSDHLIRVTATMLDPLSAEGLRSAQDANLNDAGVRQAIYRDGTYIDIPDGSDFLLRITGNISVEELNSAFDENQPVSSNR